MKYAVLNVLLVVLWAGCDDASRSGTNSTPVATDTSTAERDNTAVNVRDRSDEVKTPIDQNENQKDIDTTANIRKRVVDTEMSVNAQDVKIITQEGEVTLRGPVNAEKTFRPLAKQQWVAAAKPTPVAIKEPKAGRESLPG